MTRSNVFHRLLTTFVSVAGFAVALILVCGAVTVWALAGKFSPQMLQQQPIAFNHQKHVSGKDGIKCVTCHRSVEKDTFATLPQVDTCMDCHAIVMRMSPKKLEKKPEFGKLKQFVKAGFIPWRRIYREPEYVFFSHRRHVSVGKLNCANCHGDVSKLTSPAVRPLINQSMDWCMNCHLQRQASQDCIACHK